MKKNVFNFTSLNGERMKKVKGGTVTNPTQNQNQAQANQQSTTLPVGCSGCDRAGSNQICPSMGAW